MKNQYFDNVVHVFQNNPPNEKTYNMLCTKKLLFYEIFVSFQFRLMKKYFITCDVIAAFYY